MPPRLTIFAKHVIIFKNFICDKGVLYEKAIRSLPT